MRASRIRPSPSATSPTETSAAIPESAAWCTRQAPSSSVCEVTYSSKPASAQSPRITYLIRKRKGSRLARSTDSSCASASTSPSSIATWSGRPIGPSGTRPAPSAISSIPAKAPHHAPAAPSTPTPTAIQERRCTLGSASAVEPPMSAAPARKIAAMRRNSNDSPAWRKNAASEGRNKTAAPATSTSPVSPSASATRLWNGSAHGRSRMKLASPAAPSAAASGTSHALSGSSVMGPRRLPCLLERYFLGLGPHATLAHGRTRMKTASPTAESAATNGSSQMLSGRASIAAARLARKQRYNRLCAMKQSTARSTRREKRAKTSPPKLDGLRRQIRLVEKKLQAEITELREELRVSETALAAARLRTLNARQAQQGVARLRADLRTLRESGIIDEQGNPVHQDFPSQMLDETPDVV